MDSFLAELAQFVQAHREWAGPIVALISLGESLVVVGLLIPATAVMLLIGGLVASGIVGVVPVVVGAIIGAVLGDVISYALGRWMGPGVVHRRPFRRYRHAIAKTRLFFRKYGFAAVLFGRFLGPIRSTVPLVAGMMAMNHTRFQIANVLSAVVWAPLMLAPGWLGAKGISELQGIGGEHLVALVAVILVATVIGTVAIARQLGRREKPRRARPAVASVR